MPSGEINFIGCGDEIAIEGCDSTFVGIKIGGFWLFISRKQALTLKEKLNKEVTE